MQFKKYLVTLIIGTRPEAIKLSTLIKKFQSHNSFNARVVLTGQHKELVEQVFDIFDIKADHNLNLMTERQTLNYITTKTIEGIEKELKKNRPNLVIVQGDTTTAFAGALASFYEKIPVGHVEAGLRTDNIYDPFPEEVNRRIITQFATLHFAPTKTSKDNILKSGIKNEVFLTGNTVIDALLMLSKDIQKLKLLNNQSNDFRFILLTIHRRENRGEKLKDIAKGILLIIEKFEDVKFLVPMHPNPQVKKPLIEYLGNNPKVLLCKPLNYLDIISAMKHCYFIMTDSGGIQEEAPSLDKPVLVLRDTTERPEGLESGTAKLVGTKPEKILSEAEKLLSDNETYKKMSNAVNPFGDGKSSERIVEACLKKLNTRFN
mgnify:CR=1 FL=1